MSPDLAQQFGVVGFTAWRLWVYISGFRVTLEAVVKGPKGTQAKAFYRDIPTLFGFIVRGFMWDIPILILAYVLLVALVVQ